MNVFDWDGLNAALADAGLRAERDVPLAPATTYQVGGAARCAVSVRTGADAVALAQVLANPRWSTRPGAGSVPVLLVGRGSNLVVADGGFDGLAVFLGTHARLPGSTTPHDVAGRTGDGGTGIEIGDDGTVLCSGWVALPVLARRSVAAGRCGLQWAVGVPGTVGGGVRMNAGGHGSDMAASLVSCRVLSLVSGRTVDVATNDLGLHFRGSALSDRHLVVEASLTTREATGDECARELAEIVAWRRANQPGGRNAGSVFVNPAPGAGSAGALIDSAGLRGCRIGAAVVSDKHANFIQADDGATANDIVTLMEKVQDDVRRIHGVTLRSEVRLVGFDPETTARFADPTHDEPDRVAARSRLSVLLGEENSVGTVGS